MLEPVNEPKPDLHEPLFVAAWPGLGNVALSAAGFLLHSLNFVPIGALRDADHFEDHQIRVKDGILDPTMVPHGQFYGWQNPDGPDLLLFTSDAQPNLLAHRYCDELLEIAQRQGAKRVMAFAGLSSDETPDAQRSANVFAVAGNATIRDEICNGRAVNPLESGELCGLNAVLLARASRHELEAVGLLGEVPAAVANLPYLKASLAVLEVFADVTGIELDLAQLREQAKALDERVRRFMADARRLRKLGDPLMLPGPTDADDDEDREARAEITGRIENLFREAAEDRQVAYKLKAELDAHGLFRDYEDRFLDLFSDTA
jgi:uncharacterized protein